MTQEESITFCVAIVHFGDEALTHRAIDSVKSLRPAPELVLIVDNNEPPQSFGNVDGVAIIGRGVNSGYAGAVNQALAETKERGMTFCWVLNNDVELRPNSLEYFRDAAGKYPNAEIFGCYVKSASRTWYAGGHFDPRTGRAWHNDFGKPVEDLPTGGCAETGWINGCSLMLKTSAFERLGGFDEHLFLYKEELEWQVREPSLQRIVVREFLVDHAVGATTGSTNGALGNTFMARNGLILALRQRPIRRLRWMSAWAIDYIVRPLVKLDFQRLRSSLQGARSVGRSPMEVLRKV